MYRDFKITTPAGYHTTNGYEIQKDDTFRVAVQRYEIKDSLVAFAFLLTIGIADKNGFFIGGRNTWREIIYVNKSGFDTEDDYFRSVLARETTAQAVSNLAYLINVTIDADYHSLRRALH